MFRTSMVHPQERFQAVCCRPGMWYFAYYSIRPDVMRLKEELQPHNIRTYRVVRKIPHTKFAIYSLKTLLRMEHWGPKHVEPPSVMNKLNHKTLCILLDYIYIIKFILRPCEMNLHFIKFELSSLYKLVRFTGSHDGDYQYYGLLERESMQFGRRYSLFATSIY